MPRRPDTRSQRLWLALGLTAGLVVCSPATNDSHAGPPALRGFNFTHEGFRGGGGYGTPEAAASMDHMVATGANALAVVPYGFVSHPGRPAPIRIPQSGDGESDARLRATIRMAHERGLTVLLKPQLWVRGGWPGDIRMTDEKGWERFFHHYGEWVSHYARVAAAEGVEIFSIGVEMAGASHRTEEWRGLARRVREDFQGSLVYSANWYQEYEHVEFWDALDLAGINAYFPLDDREDPTDEELDRTAEALYRGNVAGLSLRSGLPVLLTEGGFGTGVAPWRQPHASDEEALAVDTRDQARAYAAVVRALEGQQHWLAGVFFFEVAEPWPGVEAREGQFLTPGTARGKGHPFVVDPGGRRAMTALSGSLRLCPKALSALHTQRHRKEP